MIYKNIQKLIEYKNNKFNLSDKFTKPLRDGIFELKVDLQNKTSRSLYFYEKNQMIIFTNGFIKKSQKTPPKEIEKALSPHQRIFLSFESTGRSEIYVRKSAGLTG